MNVFYIIWIAGLAGLVFQIWQIRHLHRRARVLRKEVLAMRARLRTMWLGRIQIKEGQQMLSDGIEVTRSAVEKLHGSLMNLSFKIIEKTSEDPDAAQRAKARHDRASRRFFNRLKDFNSAMSRAADDILQPDEPVWHRPRPGRPGKPSSGQIADQTGDEVHPQPEPDPIPDQKTEPQDDTKPE